jgi:agmatinase
LADHEVNFGLLPPEHSSWENSKAVIIPAPFEKSTTYGTGCAGGPRAIIDASTNMELYDIELGLEPCEAGIHTLPHPPEQAMDASEPALDYLRVSTERVVEAGKLPITLGGEHTVTVGPVQSLSKRFPSMTVLSLDAHSDLRDEYEGNSFSHACAMRRVLDTANVVEVGVRSTSADERETIAGRDIAIFTAKDALCDSSFLEKVIGRLSEDVYVSIDLDVFDPSVMPSTGTPEPGGLGWYDVLRILLAVARQRRVLGFDVVELAPRAGQLGPDFLAAKLVYKFFGYLFFPG